MRITGKQFAFAAATDSIVGILTASSQPGQFVELFVLAMAIVLRPLALIFSITAGPQNVIMLKYILSTLQ